MIGAALTRVTATAAAHHNSDGLSSQEAAARQARGGTNELPQRAPTPLWRPDPGAVPEELAVYCGVGRKP